MEPNRVELISRLGADVTVSRRDERRARADFKTPVETSPVGVLVFDTTSGRPVSVTILLSPPPSVTQWAVTRRSY